MRKDESTGWKSFAKDIEGQLRDTALAALKIKIPQHSLTTFIDKCWNKFTKENWDNVQEFAKSVFNMETVELVDGEPVNDIEGIVASTKTFCASFIDFKDIEQTENATLPVLKFEGDEGHASNEEKTMSVVEIFAIARCLVEMQTIVNMLSKYGDNKFDSEKFTDVLTNAQAHARQAQIT